MINKRISVIVLPRYDLNTNDIACHIVRSVATFRRCCVNQLQVGKGVTGTHKIRISVNNVLFDPVLVEILTFNNCHVRHLTEYPLQGIRVSKGKHEQHTVRLQYNCPKPLRFPGHRNNDE